MKKLIFSLVLSVILSATLSAQMWNGVDSLYGNEWINYDQSHFKIRIADDGIYRIPFSDLSSAGVPVSSINADNFQLFGLGEELPIYVGSDYIEFYGEKNKTQVDKFLWDDPEEKILNPHFSVISDTSAYFLTWNSGNGNERFENSANNLTNLPPAEQYFMDQQVNSYTSIYFKKGNTQAVYSSDFDYSEGWTAPVTGTTHSQTVNVPNVFLSGPQSTVGIRYTVINGLHTQIIELNGTEVMTDDFEGFVTRQHYFDFATADLDQPLTVDMQGLQFNDIQSISNITVDYPRTFDAGGQSSFNFTIESNSSVAYVEIPNFDLAGGTPVAYDLDSKKRYEATYENNLVKIAFPADNLTRRIKLVSTTSGFNSVASVHEVNFVDYSSANADFVILSHPELMQPYQGTNWVDEYANYRSSVVGGGHNVQVVDILQLYDQFGYGVDRHPLSIRNFGHWTTQVWDAPEYFFIIGKGREYRYFRYSNEIAAATSFHVPTIGWPGADNLLLASPTSDVPVYTISRLAARNREQIKVYLEKVIAYEEAQNGLGQTIEERAWMKNVLHLGGGDTPQLQASIRSHLQALRTIIEAGKKGVSVTSYYKDSSDPIQVSQSAALQDLINNGISWLTFFGHSGSETFDFDIDHPSAYENEGKPFALFSLGCLSGAVHAETGGISETWVFEPEKGAIAFFASTGQGYVSALRVFAEEYYRQIGGDMHGESLGKVLRRCIEIYDNSTGTGIPEIRQQWTMNGDPAIRLNCGAGPDYLVDGNSVNISPDYLNAQMDSFDLSFKLVNIGQNKEDSLYVEIKEELPSGLQVLIEKRRVAAPAFYGEYSLKVPVFGEDNIGENKLFITVDVDNEVEELPGPAAELNNTLINSFGSEGISFFVFANDISPVYPPEFAITNSVDLKLKASTANVFAPNQPYLIEIDTTEQFNSPSKLTTEIMSEGGTIKWEPGINYQNEMVYYWRVSPDSTDAANGYRWKTSSFVFLNDVADGWNQSHFFQMKKDRFESMQLPASTRKLKYLDDIKDIKINNGVVPEHEPLLVINNTRVQVYVSGTITSGLYIAVLDSITVEPWVNPSGGLYDSYNTTNSVLEVFPYRTDTEAEREKAINFLMNDVPDNSYVALFTIQQSAVGYYPEQWALDSLTNSFGMNLFKVLEDQGASLIRQTETAGSLPYGFFYKKNDPNFNEGGEFLGDLTNLTQQTFSVPGNWNSGKVISTTIGPASEWESLHWQTSAYDPFTDKQSIDVIGVRPDGSEVVIHPQLFAGDTTLASVDAAEFPFMKLFFNSKDSVFRTSPHLDYWRIHYKGLPEAALQPNVLFEFLSDTLQQGEDLMLRMAIENIGLYDMDSMLVNYTITDMENNETLVTDRMAPLVKEGTLTASLDFNTQGLNGRHRLFIEANPNDDQPELYHLNNIAVKDFYIRGDELNPLLDVTFDGIHIMDGDIISPKPYILITLTDENPFLALNDTSLFTLSLQHPDDEALYPLYFESDEITFYPATTQGENKARIDYNPHYLQDGLYHMYVQAQDVTGNQSGSLDYTISFRVINKQAISNVLNFPNPFSTATSFVYTLTGEEVPDFFKIQIMTVSGKIVKEITQDEMGPLRIGTHKTEYVWNGSDDFGAKLANGVYLYRMIAKKADGTEYEAIGTGADKFFKEGFGKLVILR